MLLPMLGDLVTEQLEDAADDGLLLVRQVAARTLGDRREARVEHLEVVIVGFGRAKLGEHFGDCQSIAFARGALTSRLDTQKVGHAGGNRGEVGLVVEHDEARAAEPGADGPHPLVRQWHVELVAGRKYTLGALHEGTVVGWHLLSVWWHPTMYFRIRGAGRRNG